MPLVFKYFAFEEFFETKYYYDNYFGCPASYVVQLCRIVMTFAPAMVIEPRTNRSGSRWIEMPDT